MPFSIYLITNNVNSKQYVGFSGDYMHRWRQHRFVARDSNHPDHMYLHRALAKYGDDNFTFEVIYQSKDKQHALDMEMYFIGQYNTLEAGYNLHEGGTSGGRAPGFKTSAETKAKMSAAKIGKKKSEETKAKMATARSQDWIVVHPDGTEETITNMRQFCIDNGLNAGKMTLVAQGKRSQHKGYQCRKP